MWETDSPQMSHFDDFKEIKDIKEIGMTVMKITETFRIYTFKGQSQKKCESLKKCEML